MAKAIMVQGTMSNAGKSILCAALCRIFKQDGYQVAPFKPQNMALNSFITDEGLEMGRAQAVQAEAAGVSPSVRMNPILLKPTTDTGSQVIVNGVARGTMSAREYFKIKRSLIPDIMNAYHALAAAFDIIVLEGAGSPVELNLKSDDIVNMGMAMRAKSPVVLVGDIDRGGVFAQLFGTVKLLEQSEQALVKALIVNKFRGDVTLFGDGKKMLEELTGKPVAGVVPYLDIDIDDEDSLSSRLESKEGNIAVIRLPKISNFTDFTALKSVRYVSKPSELGEPEMVILPGTKNTIADLVWLRQSGLADKIIELARRGVKIFGICGGYQMLGESISDPEGIEGGGEATGLCLLPIKTVLSAQKITKRTERGYEIHHGVSTCDAYTRGNVSGTYTHGVFDTPRYKLHKEKQYDLLAEGVRAALNMELIYKILRAGI
ncbi:MAG: cobyric acid synthase [Clostridiales bacterium]|jgi:adenosylcobyric acid synthase|nr:cobyric acid synthase [Clostridiales bacterium]